jgi:hypothetical protein
MLATFHSRGMITVFPVGSLLSLSLIAFLPGSSGDPRRENHIFLTGVIDCPYRSKDRLFGPVLNQRQF